MNSRQFTLIGLILVVGGLLFGSADAPRLFFGRPAGLLAAPLAAPAARPATALTPLTGISQVATGENHTCALTTAGGVLCWGHNTSGQVGDGSATPRLTPVAVTGLGSGVQALTAGDSHTCALTTAGAVLCWGDNFSGQLGDGSTTQRLTPVAVTGLSSGVQALTAGDHTCALTTAGAVLCWGSNDYGQLGDGSTTPQLTLVAVTGLSSGVQALTAGGPHTCALTTAGAVLCWGNNSRGQLGDGSTTQRRTPVAVTELGSGVQALTAGSLHTCALTTAGAARCWGDNSYGQLGDGTAGYHFVPVAVMVESTTNPNAVAVTLPTAATGAPGGQVTIPVLLPTSVTGKEIIAYDFRLTFNPAVLSLVSVSTADTLSSGWTVTPNTGTPGVLQVAAFNTAPLAGSGTLLNLVFNVVGASGDATPLTWTNFLFNEGEPAVQAGNGLFTVMAWRLGGSVTYRTTTRAMAAVPMTRSGASAAVATTNSSGIYSFTIQATGTHTVTPSLTGRINGISAFDAAYIAQCVAGVRASTDCPLLAADASGNNLLSAFDAAQVAQYAAGLAGPTSRVGKWLFSPASRTYATLTSDLLSENYAAYLVGEVSGNWQPPAATAAQQTTSEQSAAPLTVATATDGTVTLGHTGAEADLLAYQLTLHYDPSAGRLTEIIPAAAVSADTGWDLVVNESTPGVVELVGYGITPVNGMGALVTLRFQGAEGQVVDLSPTVVAVQLNEAVVWFNQEVRYQHFLPWIGVE